MTNLRESWRTMRSTLHLLVLLTILYLVHGSPTDLLPDDIPPDMTPTTFDLTGRIVNGTKAVLKQFPYQVSLMRSYSKTHFCGGSLISSSLVLTAGHCMYMSGKVIQPWTIMVVGGVVKLSDNRTNRQERGVVTIRIHPKFNLRTLHNDVAVLKLSQPFKFTPEVRSVPLPGNAPVPKTVCQVPGWGYQSSNIPITSPDLLYVDLPIRSVNECRKLLKNVTDLPAGMFCAGYLEGGRDACQGDSGGGMVCKGVLTGVVSGGKGCAKPLLPGVYADIFHYLNWILDEKEIVVIVQRRDFGNHGTSNMSSITIMIISFLLCAVINYTSRP
ncbi:trypsin-3-like [Temnothorax curvispinosus]|uniref:Trypsin-3-like n=1 Tax=Temnothorax curvispinosus TaxID=300111 RepID=A0A6J1PZE6_9HYME|nr:trypsin-3-like [Temnothorax curvispinosus]